MLVSVLHIWSLIQLQKVILACLSVALIFCFICILYLFFFFFIFIFHKMLSTVDLFTLSPAESQRIDFFGLFSIVHVCASLISRFSVYHCKVHPTRTELPQNLSITAKMVCFEGLPYLRSIMFHKLCLISNWNWNWFYFGMKPTHFECAVLVFVVVVVVVVIVVVVMRHLGTFFTMKTML